MTFLRLDVLAVAFVLAIPLLALGLRGDMTPEEVAVRLPWCLLAAWGAVALLRWASRPGAEAPAPPRAGVAAAPRRGPRPRAPARCLTPARA